MATMAENQKRMFHTALVDVAKTLSKKDVKWLCYEISDIPRSDADQIEDGIQLFDKLEAMCFITPGNTDPLINLLDKRQLTQGSKILTKYKEEHIPPRSDSTGGKRPKREEPNNPFKVL